MTRTRLAIPCLLLLLLALCPRAGAEPLSPKEQFDADLAALVRYPHRLAGTVEGRAAGDYILGRLAALGLVDTPHNSATQPATQPAPFAPATAPGTLFVLDMPICQTHTLRCEIAVQPPDRPFTVRLLPCRPDHIVPPATGPQGLTGPLLYVGPGELADYGARDPAGAIVAMEYDSRDNWERAFALGAKAVIFLADPQGTPIYPKHTGIPANLVRLYVPDAESANALRHDCAKATVVSETQWVQEVGRNILVYLPGTDPLFDKSRGPEMIALSAAYDSFGVVPEDSPGARGAANVAALLQTVERFQKHRPRRDLLLMFLDNHARYHQGARYVYAALDLATKRSESKQVTDGNLGERAFVQAMADMLHDDPKFGPGQKKIADALQEALTLEADNIRTDINQRLIAARLAQGPPGAAAAAPSDEVVKLEAQVAQWDTVRRLLHKNQFQNIDLVNKGLPESVDPALFHALVAAVRATFAQRLAELTLLTRMDQQRERLLDAVAKRWIDLHVTCNFSGATAGWGPVVSDWSERAWFNGVNNSGDSPGSYQTVLGAFRAAALGVQGIAVGGTDVPAASTQPATYDALPGLMRGMLADPLMGGRYVPGRYVADGIVAGSYGIYNLSLMTCFDGRWRDGHPADTLANLGADAGRIRAQAAGADHLLGELANRSDISLARVFASFGFSKRPTFSTGDGRSQGSFVGLRVTGSLAEARPAAGAVMALGPRGGARGADQDWGYVREPNRMPGFDPWLIEWVDGNGRFPIIGVRYNDLWNDPLGVGAVFDDAGRVSAMTAGDKVHGFNNIANPMSYDLFPARSGVVVNRLIEKPVAGTLKLLAAASDAPFQPSRSFMGQLDNISFFYTSSLMRSQPVKVFQEHGPVLLNAGADAPYGKGVAPARLETPPADNSYAALDLWQLNEARLKALRTRGVSDGALEGLHNRAWQAIERALGGPGDAAHAADLAHPDAGSPPSTFAQAPIPGGVEIRESLLEQSANTSRAVYTPLRQSMDDLVWSIVALLLLAVPFAFSMERLVFASTTIYARLGGFTAMFIATFLLLYFMHPGFAIASTPVIIFLAFAILLLTSLVTFIVVRKFRTELAVIQGQGVGVHAAEVSRMGTLLAAVHMGMSTMRRRPTRTVLSAVTVVILTFTILCFSSASSQVGVRTITEGPADENVAAAIMVRHLNYKALAPETLTLLAASACAPAPGIAPGSNSGGAGSAPTTAPPALGDSGGVGGGRQWAVCGQWWLVQATAADDPFCVAPADGGAREPQWLDCVMGVEPEELAYWPQLAKAVTRPPAVAENAPTSPILSGGGGVQAKIDQLRSGGVFLPAIVQEKLGLKVGDTVLFHGRRAVFAGAIDSTILQHLALLDGRTALPVDLVKDAEMLGKSGMTGSQAPEETVEREFVHVSADQVAIASAALVRSLGGDLRVINFYPAHAPAPGGGAGAVEPLGNAEGGAAATTGGAIVPLTANPVWVRSPHGVQRMVFTNLLNVTGGLSLIVPIVLGGLIIFATLLGSISDREKEIYTFSALGLAPAHVGFLFFAEAAVYAVVGGMGGQLLAQTVALVATHLPPTWIKPPSINYSSTNCLFAIALVMATVMVSAIYPAYRAGKSANPGVARMWKMPKPQGDILEMVFPFTVSAYDITGVVSFLAEHFRSHDDAGLGRFAASDVSIGREPASGNLRLMAHLALAPFDLGVTQAFALTAVASEVPGVDEVAIRIERRSGAGGDWLRANRLFVADLRRQFLLWRTLAPEAIEKYRMQTLVELGDMTLEAPNTTAPGAA